MAVQRTLHLLAAILVAALPAAAWSSGLETIGVDGFHATFDPNQTFTVVDGDLDCTPCGGTAAVRVMEAHGRLGEANHLIHQPADWNGDVVL